ncbi:hypothetical protein BpHYR1_005865 [Brachionus plicatilis]|uniref:Uncharacterized protein n=1 Tax=Brachionus plicatilis TaxID=10195 RepID=A0A3M7T9M3_BRAPC|nr:hypothetical protein BpHYR1_005865 [Brachionus plicatilis]
MERLLLVDSQNATKSRSAGRIKARVLLAMAPTNEINKSILGTLMASKNVRITRDDLNTLCIKLSDAWLSVRLANEPLLVLSDCMYLLDLSTYVHIISAATKNCKLLRVMLGAESLPYFKYPKKPILKYIMETRDIPVFKTPFHGLKFDLYFISW